MVFSETAYFRYTAVSDPYLKSSPFTECFLHYDHVNVQLKKFLQIYLGVFNVFDKRSIFRAVNIAGSASSVSTSQTHNVLEFKRNQMALQKNDFLQ